MQQELRRGGEGGDWIYDPVAGLRGMKQELRWGGEGGESDLGSGEWTTWHAAGAAAGVWMLSFLNSR